MLALFLSALLIYKMYQTQMKYGLLKLFQYLIARFRTVKAVEVFHVSLAIVLLGLVVWMIGLAQGYLYNEFTQFNEISYVYGAVWIFLNFFLFEMIRILVNKPGKE